MHCKNSARKPDPDDEESGFFNALVSVGSVLYQPSRRQATRHGIGTTSLYPQYFPPSSASVLAVGLRP